MDQTFDWAAYEQTLMIRGINNERDTAYQGHKNWAMWVMTVWIEGDEKLYNTVRKQIAIHGTGEAGATWLEEKFSWHPSIERTDKARRKLLDNPIFPPTACKVLLDRGVDAFDIAENLKKYAEQFDPLNDGTREADHYNDLLGWGLACLDYRGYVSGDVQQTPPTYRMVLNSALHTIDWHALAKRYSER